jgi:hypothetical protein
MEGSVRRIICNPDALKRMDSENMPYLICPKTNRWHLSVGENQRQVSIHCRTDRSEPLHRRGGQMGDAVFYGCGIDFAAPKSVHEINRQFGVGTSPEQNVQRNFREQSIIAK